MNLAASSTCPVQAFRVGRNVYATQFHPELDIEGLCLRIDVYRHSGYFAPEEADDIKEMARRARSPSRRGCCAGSSSCTATPALPTGDPGQQPPRWNSATEV